MKTVVCFLLGGGALAIALLIFLQTNNTPAPQTEPRETVSPRRPEKLASPTKISSETEEGPVDYPSELVRLSEAGDALAVQIALTQFFAADPVGARDWLDSQPTFAALQQALAQIATDMAVEGHPIRALEWAELLEEGEHREETIFQIYAKGRRNQSLTEEQIRAAPFPPERIALLLSGGGDD